ncbi:MAG: DNA polymerase III subunit alpha [Candidatus Westeberhardia cardiocondylae]|nr:DNA polymerase III subunit alpha [Candidatus Westeberhardia cardiocondylae]
MKTNFIHLKIHSDYSMKDGLIKINSLIKKIKKFKMPAVALTDHMNLFGLIKFYNTAYKEGIKPIIGSDITVKFNEPKCKFAEMTALAINNIGYKNIIKILSESYQNGYNNTIGASTNTKNLIKYNEGIILLSGGIHGNIGKHIINNQTHQIKKYVNFYKKYFPNRYYIEITRTGRKYEEYYINHSIKLAINNKLPIVATNDTKFLNQKDFMAHKIRVAIHKKTTINKNKIEKYSEQQYLRNEEEMLKLFSDIPESLTNSVNIAKRCNVNINFNEKNFPKFYTGNLTNKEYLIKISKHGLKKRIKSICSKEEITKNTKLIYKQRLENELEIINNMKISSYFLIVAEFIKWSKENNIPVGPGRGSGAGSLVAYALKITEIDPLKFNLLFERFLNPERTSMPDLDIDFCMEKRDLVIQHVIDTYGKNTVSQIITFGTMTAKSVIRDVGRVLGYSYNFVDQIAKLIPFDIGITLKKSIQSNTTLEKKYQTNKEIKTIINMALKLEGIIKNVGKHAGGVVIAPTNIINFSPLYCDNYGNNTVTQFDKHDIESLGLIKFDFLGLRTLTIIDKTIKTINKKNKKNNLIKIDKIPLDDKKSFKKLKNAETTAIFQLESHGIKNLITKLQPDCFEDIIALIALFRPGPLQSGMVKNFIDRKHGYEKIFYLHKKLNNNKKIQNILKSTYGVILYQEQVMQIAQVLANYTLKEADILRCAMSKKNPQNMSKQRHIFNKGTKKLGIENKLSTKIFNLIEKFSGYGFNKSHSTAYALIAYQTLWLKTHYPEEFMTSTMNADIDNTDKIVKWINECLRLNIKILPPNINNSKYYFYVEKKKIIYGLGAIKGIGKKTIKSIVEEREKNGPFLELFNLLSRTNFNILNKKTLEKLIMSGSLDSLGIHRAALMHSIDQIINIKKQYENNKIIKQIDIFNTTQSEISNSIKKLNNTIYKWPKQTILKNEYKSLGIYLSGHPIKQFIKEIKHYKIFHTPIKKIISINVFNNNIFTIIGIITYINIMSTKQKKNICFITLDDCTEKLDITISHDIIDKYKYLIEKNKILLVQGKININKINKKQNMIAKNIMDIIQIREKYIKKLIVILTKKQISYKFINNLKTLLKKHQPGKTSICLYYRENNIKKNNSLNMEIKIKPSDTLLNDLYMLVGKDKIKLTF